MRSDRELSLPFSQQIPYQTEFLKLPCKKLKKSFATGKKRKQKRHVISQRSCQNPKQLPCCLREQHLKYLCRVLSVCLTDVCDVLGTVVMLRM